MVGRTSSIPESRISTLGWAAALVMAVGLVGFALGGVWELLRGGAHTLHLLVAFLAILCLALVVVVVEFVSKGLVLSEVGQARDRLRRALLAGNSVAWDLDVKTGRDVWFGDLQAMFGIPSNEVSVHFQDFYRYVHPEDRAPLATAVAEARASHSPYACEFRIVHEDGNVRWVRASGEFYYTRRGEPVRMLGIAVDISDRRQANEALIKSEEKFSKAFRGSPVVLTLTSVRDHRYLDVNETFEEITGWSRDEVIGRTPFDINIWVDSSEREAFVRLVLAQKGLRNFEVRYGCKNGSQGVGLASAEVVEIEGEPCILSAIVDITNRKQTEDELRLKEAQLAEAQHLAQIGSWVLDPKTRMLDWSKELYRIHGLDPTLPPPSYEQLQGLFTADSGQRLRDALEQSLQTGSVPDLDLEVIRPDGTKRWVSTHGQVVRNSRGEVIAVHGTTQDITDRLRAEESLRESEERFRLVANTAPVLIWMSGSDKLCDYFNRPWLEFTGRPLEAELGNGWAEGVHPEDLDRCLQTYTESFNRKQAFEMQYRLRRHDGEYRWVVDIGIPRFNAGGSFEGYIGSCIDITERKLAEEALATIGRRLIEAHEEERTWIGRELHDDINQRLALLAVELDQWNRSDPSGAELREQVRHAQQRITKIAKDVQHLSHRLHSSKLEYLGLAKAASSFCKELSEQTKVEIAFSHAGVPRALPQEVSLCLFRVLQEALQNAVKHSGVKSFNVDLLGTPESIDLTVTDTGSGFEENEAFTRQGLGLISMRERLQLVQGKLSVKSKPGAGTTIHARVPLTADEPRAMAG